MAPFLQSVILALWLGAATAPDPIDAWGAKLSADPMWENGTYPILDLPKTATTEQVVAKVFQMTGFPGKDVNYKILEIRDVRITGSLPDVYTAVLLKTGKVEEVVLLQYAGSWWSRVLSVP